MLDYAALHALATVVREGSFERAARALHVTPSAISQRIRALEERMGGALVVRGQPCTPTETGRRLCQHVDQVRLLEQSLGDTLSRWQAQEEAPRLVVPIAVNADSLATWAAPALAQWAARHPVLMEVVVDDQDHTAQWLRQGAVLAAVTGQSRPAAGCNSDALGAMRYLAAASPEFVARHFAQGVTARTLTRAPSLVFNPKDDLQARWVRRLCRQEVQLPHHSLPSPQAFVTAALAGMGWGMHPQALIASGLADGSLVELVPGTPLDVPLYWQQARAAAGVLEPLALGMRHAARAALVPISP